MFVFIFASVDFYREARDNADIIDVDFSDITLEITICDNKLKIIIHRSLVSFGNSRESI